LYFYGRGPIEIGQWVLAKKYFFERFNLMYEKLVRVSAKEQN